MIYAMVSRVTSTRAEFLTEEKEWSPVKSAAEQFTYDDAVKVAKERGAFPIVLCEYERRNKSL